MNKSLSTIKKFQFFDLDKGEPDPKPQSVSFNLNQMTPVVMRVYNKLYFVNGQLKGDDKQNFNRFRLVKIHPCGKILDEYIPFSDTIIDFNILDLDGKIYLVALGTDLRNPQNDKYTATVEMKQANQTSNQNSIKVIPSSDSIPCIKIFEFTKFVEKSNAELNDWKDQSKEQKLKTLEAMLVPLVTIFLLKKKNNDTEFYTGDNISTLDDSYTAITDITCFSLSPRLNNIVFSTASITSLYEIKTDDPFNFLNKKERKINLIKTQDSKPITNTKHIILNNNLFLYFTTEENVYYKNCSENQINSVGEQNMHSGCEEKNFDVSQNNKILLF